MAADILLGFDFGMSRIGVAVGQSVTRTATPLTVLSARDGIPDWDEVSTLIEEWQPIRLIVGLPLNMDGSGSEMSARAEKFARRLEGRYNIPYDMVDERLSSRAAREHVDGQDQLDAIAARLILETWLNEA